ncbi:MAG TPA: M20/M25/M40 family metallo-hydrolase [bacterium]|nr:M20/M25/M40 family metallo-hydrolase [bacterium]
MGPGSINVSNAEVRFSIDLRCPDGGVLGAMAGQVREACHEIAREAGLNLELEEIWYSEPTAFHAPMVEAVARAAQGRGYSTEHMVSGAGHDAKHLAEVCPTGMIFVPCEGGISHNEAERITPEQAANGANVLLDTVLALANG